MRTGFTRQDRKYIKLAMKSLAEEFDRGNFDYCCNALYRTELKNEYAIVMGMSSLEDRFNEFYDKHGCGIEAWASKVYGTCHNSFILPKRAQKYKGFKLLLMALFAEVGPNGIK